MRYMDIEEQVDADFTRARRRAFVRRMRARLRGGATRAGLRSFEEVRKAKGAYNGVRLGTRTVPVEKIVGSVGRAYHRGGDLPPVVLRKLGDEYFVEDGNHRVSVASFQGVEWIDAEVMYSRVPEREVRRVGAGPATADLPAAA